MNLPITDNGIRPAGNKTHCFYCGEKKGKHKDDCVCVKRTVVLEMTIKYIVSIPKSWDQDMIEFHRNESSYCTSNDIDIIKESSDNAEEGTCNTCFRTSVKFIREATQEDMNEMGYTKED